MRTPFHNRKSVVGVATKLIITTESTKLLTLQEKQTSLKVSTTFLFRSTISPFIYPFSDLLHASPFIHKTNRRLIQKVRHLVLTNRHLVFRISQIDVPLTVIFIDFPLSHLVKAYINKQNALLFVNLTEQGVLQLLVVKFICERIFSKPDYNTSNYLTFALNVTNGTSISSSEIPPCWNVSL